MVLDSLETTSGLRQTPAEDRKKILSHLLLQLLSSLQVFGSSQQPKLLQLSALHSTRQEEVQGERHVLGEPAASHVHVVLGLDPEGVDLQEVRAGSELPVCTETFNGLFTSAGASFSSIREMKARLSAPSLADRS